MSKERFSVCDVIRIDCSCQRSFFSIVVAITLEHKEHALFDDGHNYSYVRGVSTNFPSLANNFVEFCTKFAILGEGVNSAIGPKFPSHKDKKLCAFCSLAFVRGKESLWRPLVHDFVKTIAGLTEPFAQLQ